MCVHFLSNSFSKMSGVSLCLAIWIRTRRCLIFTHLSVVERVRSQWDSTQHGVEARLQQLDDMIGHSSQWEEQRKEVKALIGHHEGRFHNLLQQSRDPLTKQLADNKVRQIILHVLWVFNLSFLRLGSFDAV